MIRLLRSNLLWFLLVLLIVSSCKEEETIEPTIYSGGDYLNINNYHAGDYWIYQRIMTYQSGFVDYGNFTDSIYIAKDTIINNTKAWVQRKKDWYYPTYIMDSAGYIITNDIGFKRIVFDKKYDSLSKSYDSLFAIMADKSMVEEVPAGKFESVKCLELAKMDPNTMHDSNMMGPMYKDNYMINREFVYANNVGLINKVEYFMGVKTEYKLVRYRRNR
jgi:hypothetical protein